MLSNSIYNIFHFLHYISCFPLLGLPRNLQQYCNHQFYLQNQHNEATTWTIRDTLFPFIQSKGLMYLVIQLTGKIKGYAKKKGI